MSTLTPQEIRIAKLIVHRNSREAIERHLGVASGTLRVHIGNLCRKLGILSVNPHKVGQALTAYLRRPAARSKPAKLAPSEREVVNLRIEGKTFRQIAAARKCAVSTVLCISSTACRKLRIRKSINPATLAAALSSFDRGEAGLVALTMEDF